MPAIGGELEQLSALKATFDRESGMVGEVTTSIRSHMEFLRDGEQAVLVEPHSASSLAHGIERLLTDASLRERVARNAFEWDKDYTNERSAALVVSNLRDELARGA